MKEKTKVIFGILLLFVFVLFLTGWMNVLWNLYSNWVKSSPLFSSMIQFIFLGNIGDWIGKGLKTRTWSYTLEEFIAKTPMWALIGISIKYAFVSFDIGIEGLIAKHMLPAFGTAPFLGAFGIFILNGVNGTYGLMYYKLLPIIPLIGLDWSKYFYLSLFMNATFGVALMIGHRIGDDYLKIYDLKIISILKNLHRFPWDFFSAAKNINWHTMKIPLYALPIFWLPAHTITFSLPSDYRVGMAAVLGIVLGIILGYSSRIKK